MMRANEIRRAAAAAAGSTLRDPLYWEDNKWTAIREYMTAAGCVPEARDIASTWRQADVRWGWRAPDGSWTPCASAKRAHTTIAA